ncbi:MAG TPA: DHA2 family efflux MFS transporter permease subunit [Pseudonocardia sp.]|jgi:EmrB/QacA subfamily drug resistance transporter|nr:DHA2 family efflux MFS transporter permease subunit [Pseudonocardia sp.]
MATATATAPTAPRAVATGGVQTNWIVPLAVLIVGSFMSVLDTSIVNVAIPRMQVDLNAATDDIEWVVTGYTLALGVIVPLTGWLGMRLGQTRLYVLAMVGFALGSALCGLAWNLDTMIAFRVLQAVPGGVLPVVTLILLYQLVPRDKIGAAMGVYGLGIVVAPAIGPTLGGYLVEYVDWRLIFFINVPVGVIGTVLALIVFPQIHPTTWPRFDVWGFVTIAYALFAMLLAFSEGEKWGWGGYRILGLFVSSAFSLALFVVIELEVDNPLLDLRIFKSIAYVQSLLLLGIAITGLFSGLYFLPQYLLRVKGLQEFDAGLVLLPASLVLVVLMPIAGQIYDRFGPRYPIALGLAFMAYGSYLLAQITPSTPNGDIELWLSVRNVGLGLSMMPIITAGVSSLPPSLTSAGSAMNNVMQRVASSIAIAVFGSMNTSQTAQLIADRGLLVGEGPQALPRINEAREQGAPGLLGIYQTLRAAVTAQTYANAFYVVTLMCAGAVLLALTTRSGRAKSTGQKAHVEL